MRTEKHRYLDIGEICKAYGEEICDMLPGYHSVTGCDTTSYPYEVGKVKALKKMITQGKSNLLAPLGKHRLSKQDAEKILSIMQTIMYSGNKMKILQRQEFACTNSRKTSPASLYYPTNTVQKSTLNGHTSKLIFGNNVSLKTLTILTHRNVDGK